MAQYHKIPQNVTTYQGRIVGNFTAKQFIFLAIGAIVDFLIFNTPLPTNVRIVLIVIISILCLILALANVEGKTTDAWMTSFLNAAYQPTQRTWQKSVVPPSYLLTAYHPAHAKTGTSKRTNDELNALLSIWQGPRSYEQEDLSPSEQETLKRIRGLAEPTANITPVPNKDTPPI